jgi:hypothetical protein
MAQTIPTLDSNPVIASQPIDPGLFPGLDEAFGLSGEANLDFSDLDKLDISSKLTDSEKGLEDPFAKLPRANPKDFVDTAGKDWQIGQEGVDIDMAAADISQQVLSTNQPADLTELKARQKALAKSQYYNQADNLASRALHGTIQMLPPMAGGQIAGIKKGIERGIELGAVGSAGFIAGPEFGAATMVGFTEMGVAGGNLEGSFNYWTKQGQGASFSELVDAGVNQVTAANISQFVGPVYAAIEYAQVGKLIDTVGGNQLKRGILRGAMRQLAKVVPAGAKVAAEKVAQVSARPLVKGGLNVAGNIVEQSAEEATQGVVSQAGTEYGKSQQQLIAQGARDGAMEVLANLDLPEASKQILSRGFDEFASSIGPMAVLSGGAKGISLTSKASWDGFKTLASGDLNKAAAQREAIAKAGAPLTAQAVAEDAVAGQPSATPTAETVTPTGPVVAPVDEPALDAELEAAGKAPEEALQPEAAKPTAGLPGDELGAKIFSSIRSRKPIAKADLDQVGGFSLSTDWKLNEETNNYEYQGKVYEGKEAPKVSAAEAEVAPTAKPEAKAPKAQAVAPIESAKPKVLGQVTEAISPAVGAPKVEASTPGYQAPYLVRVTPDADGTWSFRWEHERFGINEEGIIQQTVSSSQNGFSTMEEALRLAKEGRQASMQNQITQAEKVATGLEERNNEEKGDAREARKQRRAAEENKKLYEMDYPTAPTSTAAKPQIEAPALPKWEEVQKNKNKMSFLKGTFKKANAKLTKEQQVVPKAGWKKNDFYSALERMYGLITQLEFKQPDEVAPLAPKVSEAPQPTEVNRAEQRRKLKLANLLKVFGNTDLDANQILFRDLAMAQARKVASQIATQFQNLIDPDGEIYNGMISAVATRLKNSIANKTPVFFNEAGEAIPINEESVKKWLMKAADRAGRDTARRQSAKKELTLEFEGKPAEGVITQPESDKEERKPEGMQIKEVAPEAKEEPRAIRAIREAAQAIREQSSPEAKVVLDWVVSQLVGEDSALGKIKTYKELAAYLSKVAKRTISDKRVGVTVNDVVKKLADNLSEIGIKVNTEALEMALSPEGQKAKERLAAEEAKTKAARDERTAKANLSDRARNLRSGYAVKQRVVDAVASATSENRARIQNEVIALAEEDLLEDADINNRLDNIEKGLQNEKPAVGQPIPRRGRRGTEQTKESKVLGGTGEGVEGARGTTGPVATATGQPQPGARGVEPVGARPSGAGRQVGGTQQTTTGNVSVDVKLSSNNRNPAVKVLVKAATSNGVPVVLQDSPESNSAVAVDVNQVEGQEVPIIRVNQKLLAETRRVILGNFPEDGEKRFAEWAWRAVNQELVHFRHLKLLERLAKEEGTDYKTYLKKEAKRVVQYIKGKRGLRKRIEAIYNGGAKMDDFNLAFEFTRMLVEQKMVGDITESAYLSESDIQSILLSMDSEGRGFIFRFMELVRDLLYGLTGRTEAETRFLRATADAIINEQRKIMRNLYSPNEKLPVQLKFYTPKEKVIVGSAADRKASEEEIRNDTGLNRANMGFLREYARELGIQEPMIQVKKPIKDEKSGKMVERKISFPAWKKQDYVKAIKEKLKELGKKPKELGAAMPMRFKTEYAFQQIDRAVATKKGIFKGLTIDNTNTLPWENLKAKILKGTSKAEANWVLPTLEALVRNDRVAVDQAVSTLKALARSKITIKKIGKTASNEESPARNKQVNPKPIRDMEDLREVLVKTPIGEVAEDKSHFLDKDVVGFGRMYTTRQGDKTGTFLFEAQTDVAKLGASLEEATPLVNAYESLVLKNAIADAIAKDQDFIAITDAETAAMTEGHTKVKEGMRVHYGIENGSLHNLAKKLTGDIGTPFNDGSSSYVYEQEEADRTETPPELNRFPKRDVTGVSYSLDRIKSQGEESSIYNILGAAMPTDRPYWLKPDGEVLEVDDNVVVDWNSVGGHAESAIEFLRENDPSNTFLVEWSFMDPLKRKERQQLPIQEMINMGWLRVVGDGFNLFFEGDPNKTQLDKLFEAAIEDEVKLIQDQTGLTGRAKSNVWYEPPVEDELGAAMPRLGFSTTEPRFRRAWKELPESLDDLTEFRQIPRGTHDVRLYRDSTGDLFAVKRGQTQEQFENEIAAENVYRIMNYPVPRSKLIKDENGNTAKIASWVDGPTLKEFKKIKTDEDRYEDVEEVYSQIGNGMVIDAFLFNYDVLGLDLDNIVVAHDLVSEEDGVELPEPEVYYTPYRVDNGGTFDTRARGGLKDAFFYDSFQDLTTKYPEIDVTASEVVAQIGDLVLNSDAILNVIPKRLRPMMAQRLQWMADQLSAADIMPPAAGQTEQQVEEHFKRLSAQLAQVELVKNEKGELINSKTGIPSRIYLLGNDGKILGFTPKSEFRYRLERTPVFKMWFGDWENAPDSDGTSDIKDQAGEPWVMYHGTSYSKRTNSQGLRMEEDQKNAEELRRYPRKFSTANLFRGIWSSTSRQFAEDWAAESEGGEYDENVVIPVYVKSTNTFDPRNKEHAQMLVSYLKDKMSFDTYTRNLEVALEFGFYDWTYFEPQTYSIPETREERELKEKYFKKYPYTLLESIVNMGFDGLWVREKALGLPGQLETSPKNLVEELEIIRRTDDKTYEERTIQTLKEDVAKYNENSVWNHLSFRSDGIKSAMNTGRFSAKKSKAFEAYPEAVRFLNQVSKNNKTGWNEFEKGGKIYASYDKPENLVTYAFSDSATLARANVAKTELKKSGVVFFGKRTVQDVRSAAGRAPGDILGAAMPRKFGVRIKDKMAADAYDKLKNLTYEPIPDSMVQEEAEAYLEKHGIRGAMEATISKASPLEHGSRELLAQLIILKLNEQYKKTKDARILEDLIDYTDTFLAITSEAGRSLRQLSFWSKLTPEGMLMLYKKKLDEVNRETRDRFNEFFAKVKRELSTLPAGALDQALKNMEGLLGKADKAAEESRKKLATSNTMTFWENFSKQIGDSLVQKSQEQLNAAEEELARTAGGEATPEGQTAMAKVNNAKTINQAAQEMSRNIKQMFLSLAKEQGKNIRDPRILTDEEFANKTDEEIAKIQQAERDSLQAQKFTDMLARWPKALQAWQTATDAIRAQTAVNPELATMFQSFLDLTLETPFTMPQLRRFLSLKGVKLEDLIREHYQEGKLANNAYSLAKQMVEEAGLGAWEEDVGSEVTTPLEMVAEGEEPKPLTKKLPGLSERLTQALALQIEKYAEAESAKKLNRLVESYSDKRLEPSLKRFIKRMVQYQALGLFNNAYAWNEFQKQEGLDKLKPEVVNKILEVMGKAEKLTGFRKEEAYADALSIIAYETNTGIWNFTKSWWYLSILSGITTQAANLVGNTYNTILLTIPTIGKHLISGTTNPERSKAILKQMFRAMSLSLQDLGYVITTGRIGTRKSDNPFFSQASTDYFEVIARNSPNMASRIGATAAATIRRAMSGVDMMFYNFNKEVYLFDSAYNEAKNSGLKGSEATAKALDLTFRSSEALQSALALAKEEGYVVDGGSRTERAKQKIEQSIRIQEIIDARVAGNVESSRVATEAQVYGEELTYNEEPKGFLGAIHRSISSLTVKYGLVSVPIPFTKIVANVWNQGLDATGLGLFRSGKLAHGKLAKAFPFLKILERLEMKGLTGSADEVQAKKDMMYARGFNAMVAVGVLSLLDKVLCGQYETYGFELCINGPGPKEPAQKELLKNRLRWKPNSVFFRTPGINGVYLSYMLSPVAIPMAAIGLLKDNETYNYYAKKSPKDASLAMAHRMLTVPMEMNFLSGLADMFEILSPSNPEAALAKTKSFLSRMGSAMIVPNFFRDIDQLVVSSLPGVLNPRTAREDVIQAAFISNTPIIRQMYGSAELDILGQPIEMTSRIGSFAEKDALVDVLIQKNALPTSPKKDKLFGIVPMTDEQYAKYRQERGRQLGADLNKPEMIQALSRMEPAIAQVYVQKYTQKANALAKAKLIREDSGILEEARETKSKQFK